MNKYFLSSTFSIAVRLNSMAKPDLQPGVLPNVKAQIDATGVILKV